MATENKDYVILAERSEFGRSSVDIKCPYCGQVVTAFKWSLAGGGKKCPCGAKHTYLSGSIKVA